MSQMKDMASCQKYAIFSINKLESDFQQHFQVYLEFELYTIAKFQKL